MYILFIINYTDRGILLLPAVFFHCPVNGYTLAATIKTENCLKIALGTKAARKVLPADFANKKEEYLQKIHNIVDENSIPEQLIINWDQTGIYIATVTLAKLGVLCTCMYLRASATPIELNLFLLCLDVAGIRKT